MGVVVLAVLIFGIKNDGAFDWVSIITAIAGVVLAVTGLYTVIRTRGTRPALKR